VNSVRAPVLSAAPQLAGSMRFAAPLRLAVAMRLAAALALAAGAARADETTELLSHRIEALRAGAEVQIGRDRIAAVRVLPDLYERAGFALLWTRPGAAGELLAAIRGAAAHGLDPDDYHRPEIEARLAARGRAAERVELDILLTDALARLAYHLAFGKVDPVRLEPHWNLASEVDGVDPAEALRSVIEAPSPREALEAFAPGHEAYHDFRAALARYRLLAARGGFEGVPAGPKLALGSEGARVAALRRRLAAEGDLPPEEASESAAFDAALEQAVKGVQRRFGLEPDGVVGPATLAALDVAVEARIDQIRLNLERARWVLHGLRGRLVLVDVPGFHLHFFEDGIDWTARVIVGRPYRKTPTFRSAVRYLVLNPTWTVPPGIFAKDILPEIRKDPGYLARKRLRVIDARGHEVDAAAIDWARVARGRFPYQLRQDPGPDNALGRIKFMFPNPHMVYLHDTPARELFERAERAFSSGCIRVEDALALAVRLLDDPQRWSREALEREIAKGTTQTVSLREPVPVILVYWTLDVDRDGSVHFPKDLYRRDPPLLRALDQDFSFRRASVAGRERL
jgi:murein L,D-transpeptidase YcbB/YkuD